MQIKMTEYFQGTGQPSLEINQEYSAKDIGAQLCNWLIEHKKAVDITPEQKPISRARKTAAKTTRGRAKKNEGN